ncbi:aminotransferase class I/II-fold pyridoxal phosphate-dependent enzyme [Paenibacillus thiaminolyticus]|uniref:Aminotransferase class I/II-fold pyridoxal phosphate-dependent enzyme n=1 Tax=Paenibacillus thiaminolyticus TaxID=49283 RepID=A0A3A3GMW8_PANTH|nr:aminotransferase class I/II-fold pyridoxal phosphate-dependent enzyme [Paenibacillus thiaminolyticus]RJG26640.1 aminotransferase class I/II-fold pyridoxal phosphate-dependent enzyme [Paenibacillus thiaminolyticus]
MTANRRIWLSPPHTSGREQDFINEAFTTNWIAPLGPHVDAFEAEIAAYAQVKGAAAVSSGTAAIHLALTLLGAGKGDLVFCSSLTFVASANPISYTGAKPVFIDSEPDTWNMSPSALERALKEAARAGNLPKAVIVVHLYGQSAKMNEIMEACERYEVPVIEDAAESLGSLYYGKASGSMGRFGIYSFNGNKIITTSGGGMLISNHRDELRRARFLATQAREPALHYQHQAMGFNYRMSNVLAGIGRAQLQVLNERVEARRSIFEKYRKALGGIDGIQFMPELENTRSNRWLTALTMDARVTGVAPAELIHALEAVNIESRPVWKPLHLQPLFHDCLFYAHGEGKTVSEQLFETGICLPSGSGMSEADQQRVIDSIQEFLSLRSANAPAYR